MSPLGDRRLAESSNDLLIASPFHHVGGPRLASLRWHLARPCSSLRSSTGGLLGVRNQRDPGVKRSGVSFVAQPRCAPVGIRTPNLLIRRWRLGVLASPHGAAPAVLIGSVRRRPSRPIQWRSSQLAPRLAPARVKGSSPLVQAQLPNISLRRFQDADLLLRIQGPSNSIARSRWDSSTSIGVR